MSETLWGHVSPAPAVASYSRSRGGVEISQKIWLRLWVGVLEGVTWGRRWKKKIAEMYTDRWKTTVQRRTRMLNFKKSLSLKISRITTLEIHWASNLPALQFHVEKCLGFFGWDHLADKEWHKHRAMSLRQRSKIFELVRAIQTFFLCYCSALHGRIVTCHQQVQQSKSCNDSSLTAKLLKCRVYVIHGSVYFPKKKGLQASNPTDPFQANGGYSAISQCLHQMIFSDVSSTH